MSEPKWTKGLWVIGNEYVDDEGYREIPIHTMIDGITLTPAAVCLQFPQIEGMQDANARLIAAAPELYAALEGILNADGRWRDNIADTIVDRAHAALARARGEKS